MSMCLRGSRSAELKQLMTKWQYSLRGFTPSYFQDKNFCKLKRRCSFMLSRFSAFCCLQSDHLSPSAPRVPRDAAIRTSDGHFRVSFSKHMSKVKQAFVPSLNLSAHHFCWLEPFPPVSQIQHNLNLVVTLNLSLNQGTIQFPGRNE